ncbi:MAG: hypothetical protein GW913_15265 [Myxococcales bacterium]|nr:hypothetical protein [Myxococcales bacterium]
MENRPSAARARFNRRRCTIALLCLPLAACDCGGAANPAMDGSVDASPDGSATEGGTVDGATLDGASPDGSVDGAADGSTTSDGGSPEEALARMVQLCHDWGDVVCRAQQDCCMADERMDASEAACQMRYYVGCDYLLMGAAWIDGRIHFDVAATEADLDATRALAAACDPDARSESTKNVSGTLAAGADCTPVDAYLGPGHDASALLACDPGLYCKLTMEAGALHGVCTNLEGLGNACTGSNDCVRTLTCGASSTCEEPAADGALCAFGRDCAGGYCDHHACTSTPHPDLCND